MGLFLQVNGSAPSTAQAVSWLQPLSLSSYATYCLVKSGDRFQIGGTEFIFMEERGLEDSRKLSDTLEIFASLIKYQTPFLDPDRQNSGSMRLQGTLLSTPIFRTLAKKELRDLEDITIKGPYAGVRFYF